MTDKEWIDLLSKEWNVSRSMARKMLHGLYQVKILDTLRKECHHDED